MAALQGSRFQRIQAVHPDWEATLILSGVDDTLVHETHGSRGRYRLSDGTLHVAWDSYPAEDFMEVDGTFLHCSLLHSWAQPAVKAAKPGDAAGPGLPELPIQVVSLQRTPDRRQRFAALNDGVEYEFFDAVDGQYVDQSQFFGGVQSDYRPPYSAGAIGCALSHLALWERAIRDQQAITIIEDDAVLRRDFAEQSRAVIAGLPADWDLVMWGWNFDSILSVQAMPGISPVVLSFDQDRLRQSIQRFKLAYFEPHVFRLDKCFGTCGYSISPAGSRKFKEGCFPPRNEGVFFPGLKRILPNNGIDIGMNRLYSVTQSYVAFPPLAVTPNFNTESLTLPRVLP